MRKVEYYEYEDNVTYHYISSATSVSPFIWEEDASGNFISYRNPAYKWRKIRVTAAFHGWGVRGGNSCMILEILDKRVVKSINYSLDVDFKKGEVEYNTSMDEVRFIT